MLQLKANKKRLVEYTTLTFTSTGSVLSEMLQNSRRSKATRIDIEHDVDTGQFTITDNGVGINDFQDLLIVAESGWDEETKEQESPFGVGILSCYVSAAHVTAESKGMRFSAKTADILNFNPLAELTPCLFTEGTRITLSDFKVDNVLSKLRLIVRGFPVPVFYNQEELERPHALNSGLEFIETPVGKMHVDGLNPGRDSEGIWPNPAGTTNVSCYLQGLPVAGDRRSVDGINIVHLETGLFRPRMPDRDMLYDEAGALTKVDFTIHQIWRNHLVTAKRRAIPREFVYKYYCTTRKWNSLDLLNDIDELPDGIFCTTGYPVHMYDANDNFSRHKSIVNREDIEQERVRICSLPDLEMDDSSVVAWMYAYLMETLVLFENLDEGHWIMPYVHELHTDDIIVTVDRLIKSITYSGSWVWKQDAYLCRGYTMSGPFGYVYRDDEPIFANGLVSIAPNRPAIDMCCDGNGGVVLVPDKGRRYAGQVVQQIASFIGDDESVDENAQSEEGTNFTRFILSQSPGKASWVLKEILEDTGLTRYPSLIGKRFELQIDNEGRIKVMELSND